MILLIIQTILLLLSFYSTIGYINNVVSFCVEGTGDKDYTTIQSILKSTTMFGRLTVLAWGLFYFSVKVSEYL